MTDAVTNVSCTSVAPGTVPPATIIPYTSLRIEMDILPVDIDTSATKNIKIGVQAAGTTGTLILTPYSDANTIDTGNEITTASISGAGDVVTALTANWLNDLVDLGGGRVAFRIRSGGTADIQVSECNWEIGEVGAYTLAGVTKDVTQTVLGSVEYSIQERTALSPETWRTRASYNGTSHADTGAFTEEVRQRTYRILAVKDVTPQVMDIGPPIIGFHGATSDTLTLGANHSLGGGDIVRVYQAGSSAIPVGLVVDTDYYIITLSGDTCELSLSQGGAAVNITTAGQGWLVGTPETT